MIITNVLLFNKINWKILHMILALKFFYTTTSNYSLVQPAAIYSSQVTAVSNYIGHLTSQ